jgi:hypothetical protein
LDKEDDVDQSRICNVLFSFQYFLRSTVVLPRKYWSTPYAVLEYFFGSTEKAFGRNRRLAEIVFKCRKD